MVKVNILRNIVIVIALSIAVYQDITINKVKNQLTLSTLIIGLILSLVGGTESIIDSLLGIIIPFTICYIFYLLRMLGAGDVKLYCALGAVMGRIWIINCMIYSVLAGGVIALLIMIYHGNFIKRIGHLFNYLKCLILVREFIPYQSFSSGSKATFPYAIAIAFGGIISVWVHF